MTENQQSDITPVQILRISLDIAQHMVESGGEIQRVENTVERICMSYGASRVDVFCITTYLSVMITMPDGCYDTQSRRIRAGNTDLYRLERLNALSRKICREHTDLACVPAMLQEALDAKPYPNWLRYGAAALAAGSYAVYFGGTWYDGLAASAVAVLLSLLIFHQPKELNPLAGTVLQAILTGLLSILFVWMGLGSHADMVIIGAIMLMTPGLALASALRDMLCGDTISGLLRMMSAILSAAAIAVGMAVSLTVAGGLL